MKKLMVVGLVLGALSVFSLGATAEVLQNEQYRYEVTDGEVTILAYTGTGTDVVIPDEIDNCPVTRIGESAFEFAQVVSVSLPNSLKTICGGAFFRNSELQEIVIPSGCGELKFGGEDPDFLFLGCDSFVRFVVDENNMVYKSVDGMLCTKDGTRLLLCPSGVTELHIPQGVKIVDPDALRYLTGASFFQSGITSIHISASVEDLGEKEADGDDGPGAFFRFTSADGFYGFYVDEGNSHYCSYDGVLYSNGGKRLLTGYSNMGRTLVIPEGVEEIALKSLSYMMSSLEKIKIPSTLVTIADGELSLARGGQVALEIAEGNGSFVIDDQILYSADGKRLLVCLSDTDRTTVAVKAGVETIDSGAFSGYEAIESVTLPDTLKRLGELTFWYCNAIRSLTLPASLVEIGRGAFPPQLTEIIVDVDNPVLMSDASGLYSKDGKTLYVLLGQLGVDTIVIPEGVEYFAGELPEAQTVVYPTTIKSIGDSIPMTAKFMQVKAQTPPVVDYMAIYLRTEEQMGALREIRVPDESVEDYRKAPVWSSVANLIVGMSAPPYVDPVCTVTFDLGGHARRTGGGDLVQQVSKGCFVEAPVIEVDSGWRFLGWNPSDWQWQPVMFDMTVVAQYEYQRWADGEYDVDIADGFGIYCKIADGEATLTGYYEREPIDGSLDLVIPSEIGGCPLVSISKSAFSYYSGGWPCWYGCSALHSVVIPGSVKAIGRGAFAGCPNLTYVEIEDGVVEIGEEAFLNCSSLVEASISRDVMDIGSFAFGQCESLLAVTLREGAIRGFAMIGGSAFAGCSSLEGVVIPSSVGEIGSSAFSDCESLRCLTLSDGLVAIGERAFDCCRALATVVVPSSVLKIGNAAFKCCESAKSIILSDGIVCIGDEAFEYCRGITEMDIPGSVREIGCSSFVDCESLVSVTLHEGLRQIDIGIFDGSSVKSLTIPGSVRKSIGTLASLEELVLCEGVEEVDDWFMCACESLTHVSLPTSLKRVGQGAFSDTPFFANGETALVIANGALLGVNREKLENEELPARLVIPEGVRVIADYCFCGESFEEVVLPNSLRVIGRGAFQGSSLGKFLLPSSVEIIHADAFLYTDWLENLYDQMGDVELGFATSNGCILGYKGDPVGEITIPDGVKFIPEYLFAYNDQIAGVSIPSSVKWIGQSAFEGCSSLQSVVFAGGVKSIGHSAFRVCNALECVELPDSLESLGDCAFEACYNLQSVTLREGVSYIGDYAFSVTMLDAIKIPGSVRQIGDYAFECCHALQSVEFSDGIERIGEGAFYECGQLKEIEIPQSVKWMGSAFLDCASLSSVRFLGNAPFIECGLYSGVSEDLVTYVRKGSTGWSAPGSAELPRMWPRGEEYQESFPIEQYESKPVVVVDGEEQDADTPLSEIVEKAAEKGKPVTVEGDVTEDVTLVPGAEVIVKGEVLGEVAVKVPAEDGSVAYDITEYVKGVATASAEGGAVVLKPELDAEKVEPDETLAEVFENGVIADLQDVEPGKATEVTLTNVKPGLYYSLAVSSSLDGLDVAAEKAPKVQATQAGVSLDVTKPEGDSAFMKLHVSDRR